MDLPRSLSRAARGRSRVRRVVRNEARSLLNCARTAPGTPARMPGRKASPFLYRRAAIRLLLMQDEQPKIFPVSADGEASDEDLMRAVQAKDPDALAALYDRYGGVLKALIMRIIHNEAEADDLLQEIYMELWNHASNYSAGKGKPLGWIVTLARRRSIDRLRKRQSYARAEERLQLETEQQPDAWVHNNVEDAIDISDMRATLQRIMSGLPAPQRQAIELAFFKGMSQREIAAHTNIPLGTIKTRLELGLKKIADSLRGLKNEF
jgi:RNA polymerase sigma-70 factor, ECF subfamily